MTREDLQRCDLELTALTPRAGVDADAARELRIFNENVRALRRTLLDPAREQLERSGEIETDLATRLYRGASVIGPWRRTLQQAYPKLVEEDAGEIVIRPEGVFDALEAWSVRGRLECLPRDANVVLDFSDVGDVSDLGVAVIATGLRSARVPRVRARGLLEHHYRLFRYFGIDASQLQRDGGPAPTR